MRAIYTALFYAAVPFILLRLYWRGRGNPAYRKRIGERFGRYDGSAYGGGVIWLHAVSVGETESAVPLVKKLHARYPGERVLVTTTTPTGSARVQALFGDSVEHCYLPYDLPGAVSRFMDRFSPRLAIVMETEIWPNLFAACANRSLPLVIANGRLSNRSAKGYGRVEGLVRQSLNAVAVIAAQTREDAQRFESIGARPERIVVTGNIKFDLDISDETVAAGRQHRDTFFGGRPALIAASTHDDEERRLLTVFGKLREKVPRLLMAVAPRHPERFAVVASLCRESGYGTVLRSERRRCGPQDDIFVLDSLGELRTFFAAADVAFIGGSLVPIGGHNLLEPAVLGLPVVFGPHVANFKEISATLVAAGGGIQIDGLESLLAALEKLFRDTAYRRATGMRGKDFVLQNRGATERVLAILDRYLSASWSAVTGSPAM